MEKPESIRVNVPGSSLTALGVGGYVAYYLASENPQDIAEAEYWAQQSGLSIVISRRHILVAPRGFPGLVIVPPVLEPRTAPFWSIHGHAQGTPASLITQLELGGKAIGGMQVPINRPETIMNAGQGTVDQAVQLISFIKQQVRDKLGVQLQENIDYLGFS